ncbi:aldehyde dehydrogenase family protein [Kyrpidia spormannii]|uniref:aldehyde dehydrogenase family protein n=1 Tax=Kyrpidia spormannii TaxID=2055160 RepID=UPI001E5E3239|nr:aldehyde dehydrogenase family protein [Kyrpidia spormannii]
MKEREDDRVEPTTVIQYIDGQWRNPRQPEWFESVNPANGETVAVCAVSPEGDVEESIAAAKNAFRRWRRVPAPQRATYLWKVAEILEARKPDLARMMTLEMGKVLAESLAEVDTVIASCRYMAGEGRRMFGDTLPSGMDNRTIMTVREPIGVVACITPWNFPLSLAAYKLFAALVAGNTVVWKPSSEVAVCAKLFTEVFEESGLPPGVLNLVLGSGARVGNLLARHPDVRAIAFTGSTEVGKGLAEMAGRTLKRVSLELGGKNAVLVLADADLDKAAAGIVQSAFATSGQRCTAAGRVIVEASVQEELERRIVQLTEKLTVGYGLDPKVQMGPLANAKQFSTVSRYVLTAKDEGGRVLFGGHPVSVEGFEEGFFYAPTVITNVQRHHRIAREEVFGPVLAILTARDFDEAVEINNETQYGLSTAVYTNNLHYANRAARECESGLVYINSGTSNAEMGAAFGGFKDSGNGHREVSYHAFDVMTEWKTIYTSY